MILKDYFKKITDKDNFIPTYKPKVYRKPDKMIEVVSAWAGLELVIEDILDTFNIGRDNCIEFGVEFGYSSVVFSNYFKKVTGVDTFQGDQHTDNKEPHFEKTSKALSKFANIELIQSDYKDWIKKDQRSYDFAHVDIVHNYTETFECGIWAAAHSHCTIFHDTDSFPDVRKAVIDIAKKLGKRAFNYPKHYGLGIIVE